MSRFVVAALGLALFSGCAGMKFYRLPLSPREGQAMVPALIATSEGMGLRSWRGQSGAVTDLENGTQLSWQNSADNEEFILLLTLPGDVAESQREARWAEGKMRADQIWQYAVAARQQSGAAMMVVPVAPVPIPVQNTGITVAVPGMSFSVGTAAPVGAQPQGTGQPLCRSGVDCGPGAFCRDRGDGVNLCMGSGGAGAFCASGIDCGPGLFCRDAAPVRVCQP